SAPLVTLGEGDTPLVFSKIAGREIGFKLDYLNPTGSFKDRGTAPLVSVLLSRGILSAVEDSSGNAGASFAAYAAQAGIQARVFVPDYAAGPKRAQIAAYGAELVRIAGPRSNATIAVQRAADDGAAYASHVHQPFGLMGMATIAYEIVAALGSAPGTLVTPVGQGSLLLGAWRGFKALYRAGVIRDLPRLVGVQAAACAPIWAVFTAGAAGLSWVTERETAAEGVRIKNPIRGDLILQAVQESHGTMVAVEEKEIQPGRDALAGLGYCVEPTSAIVWDGLNQVLKSAADPVVVMLTGSGYKSLE
ncbi:MAG: pyridoxal-phosphate dependent enzyme, partial [Anaerolineales bacterium]|nr:pyridoxal-phosphate dependent enzyme [Anaerolineales bacterium]